MITDFLSALKDDMPPGVYSFVDSPIGEVGEISPPETKDAAVIACGKLAATLNNAFLRPFIGLTPVELFLRVGQNNPVFISSLLSSMEWIGNAETENTFAPDTPENGVIYAPGEMLIQGHGSNLRGGKISIKYPGETEYGGTFRLMPNDDYTILNTTQSFTPGAYEIFWEIDFLIGEPMTVYQTFSIEE